MLNTYRSILIIIFTIFTISACENESPSTSEPPAKASSDQMLSNTEPVPSKSCELTMGWESWAPYHYQEFGEEVKGLDIELMNMITAETGCKISYQKGDWKELLMLLKDGQIDLLTGASINEKRKQYATFSDGYRTEAFQLYVRKGEAAQYDGLNMKTLVGKGFRLGITMDYIYNDEVNTLQDDPANADKVIAVSTGLINYSKLSEHEIDGFLEDPVVGSSSIRRQGLENQIEQHSYLIQTGDVHVMFSKVSVDEATVVRFNQALATIRKDGRHQKLMDKYTK